jgi:5-formyltetrahydrofolate cyclo-ligase
MEPWGERHPAKEALRQTIWTRLSTAGVGKGAFVGHIPNFVGAELAAERLAGLEIWQTAQVIKCNPDSPQCPVRLRALADGKLLYMAVPRLAKRQCFVALSAAALTAQGITLQAASTMKGAMNHGKLVSFEEMQPIDLVVVGCVAVTPSGGRTGKGAGFADLELAMLSEVGLVSAKTPIVTTVHGLQVVDTEALPMEAHDWALNYVVTPEATMVTHTKHTQPKGMNWDAVKADQVRDIPILRDLSAKHEHP